MRPAIDLLRRAVDELERADDELAEAQREVARLAKANDDQCDEIAALREELAHAEARIMELERKINEGGIAA